MISLSNNPPVQQSFFFHQIPEPLLIDILKHINSNRTICNFSISCKSIKQLFLFNSNQYWFIHYQIFIKKLRNEITIFIEKNNYRELIFDFSEIIKEKKIIEEVRVLFNKDFFQNEVSLSKYSIKRILPLKDNRAIIIYSMLKDKSITTLSLINLSSITTTTLSPSLSNFTYQDEDITFAELSSLDHLIVKFTEKIIIFDANNLKTHMSQSVLGIKALKVDKEVLYYSIGTSLTKFTLKKTMLELANSKSQTLSEKESLHDSDIKELYIDSQSGLIYAMDNTSIIIWTTSFKHPQKIDLYNYNENISNYSFVSNYNSYLFLSPKSSSLLEHHLINKDSQNKIAIRSILHIHDHPITAFCIHQPFLVTASKDHVVVWDIKEHREYKRIPFAPLLNNNPQSIAICENHIVVATEHKIIEFVTEKQFWTIPNKKKSSKKFLGLF